MTIRYFNNHFRSSAEPLRLLLPFDTARATQNGYEQTYQENALLDGPIGDFVKALARKNWDMPGIECDFDILGKPGQLYHQLSRLSGGVQGLKWEVHFNRSVYTKNETKIYSEPNEIIIPRHQLQIDEDGLATYYPYVGHDWYEDEETFHGMDKFDRAKEDHERIYLVYELQTKKFRHQTDFGRHYSLEKGEPATYHEKQVYRAFAEFFENLTWKLDAIPDIYADPYEAWEKLTVNPSVAAPLDLKPFYIVNTIVNHEKTKNIIVDKSDKFFLSQPLFEEYPIDPLLDAAYQVGFSMPPFKSQTGLWGDDPMRDGVSVVKVNLKYANDIYVVDEKPMMAAHSYFLQDAYEQGRQELADEEQAILNQILSRTLVKLADYKNNYDYPMFLVDRILYDDEATVMTEHFRSQMDALSSHNQEYIRQYVNKMMVDAL